MRTPPRIWRPDDSARDAAMIALRARGLDVSEYGELTLAAVS